LPETVLKQFLRVNLHNTMGISYRPIVAQKQYWWLGWWADGKSTAYCSFSFWSI